MSSRSADPNNPHLLSWVPLDTEGNFPIQNLPLGIFEAEDRSGPRPGAAIGNQVLDLLEAGLWPDRDDHASLNALIRRGPTAWSAFRREVSSLLNEDNPELRDDAARIQRVLLRRADVQMRMPVEVGDYVDFYSSLEHATNVGKMFRDPANPLLPNWRWLPIGYHGRAGTLAVSGTPVRRPQGQLSRDNQTALYAPSEKLDIELETAFIVGAETVPGETLTTADAARSIFGMVLLNDWSARDIQRWEYVPLGPFLGKSFLTSISPWVVMMEALEPYRVEGPAQAPTPLPYLQQAEPRNFNIELEVLLQPEFEPEPVTISRTNFRGMYWSMAQQLAHLTSNGTRVRPGDLCASGTVSGDRPGSSGSLLELTWNGSHPLTLPDGTTRTFLQDGDTVILRGWCAGPVRIGFGEVRGKVLPA